jgi:hypothetical protein
VFTVENRAGRLLEAKVTQLKTRDDALAYAKEVGRVLAAMPETPQPILWADHRAVVVYPPPVTEQLLVLFAAMNARLERVAILVAPTNATLLMQLRRIVREARYESRRVFTEASEARGFLGQLLGPTEHMRLDLLAA